MLDDVLGDYVWTFLSGIIAKQTPTVFIPVPISD